MIETTNTKKDPTRKRKHFIAPSKKPCKMQRTLPLFTSSSLRFSSAALLERDDEKKFAIEGRSFLALRL